MCNIHLYCVVLPNNLSFDIIYLALKMIIETFVLIFIMFHSCYYFENICLFTLSLNLLTELRARKLYFYLLKYSFLDVFPFCSFKLPPYTNFLSFKDFFQYLLQSRFLAVHFFSFCLFKVVVFLLHV